VNELAAFVQVVLIDLVLAGDNAVVIGALASGLLPEQRRRVIAIGIGLAVAARIVLSLGVVWLLLIPGIRIVGGALLLWVAWKMWRDIRDGSLDGSTEKPAPKSFFGAVAAVIAADLSMSLDNVLGVAGAAIGHAPALIFGLILSMGLMGAAANFIAKIINRQRWIVYVGLALILFIAGRLIYEGVLVL
jgi:YjbE family integral membrane protein